MSEHTTARELLADEDLRRSLPDLSQEPTSSFTIFASPTSCAQDEEASDAGAVSPQDPDVTHLPGEHSNHESNESSVAEFHDAQQSPCLCHAEVCNLRNELAGLKNSVSHLLDVVLSISHKVDATDRRTEVLLYAQEEPWSGVREGHNLSCTISGELFSSQANEQDLPRDLGVDEGLDHSQQANVRSKQAGPALTDAVFVLRDTPRASVRSSNRTLDNIAQHDVSDSEVSEISPSNLKSNRTKKPVLPKPGNRRQVQVQIPEGKEARAARDLACRALRILEPATKEPIEIADSHSGDESEASDVIEVQPTIGRKRSLSKAVGGGKAVASPCRKKPSVQVPTCEVTPEPSASSADETSELLARFGIKAPEQQASVLIHDKNTQNNATDAEAESNRPRRQAAINARETVKDICVKFPIIYKTPQKAGKARRQK